MSGKFSNLSGMGLRRASSFEDEDPTSGLANLSDCMLVLACGLMVALVMAWNIPMNVDSVEVSQTDEKQEISDPDTITKETDGGTSQYIDMGRVYKDPTTGKYYMIESPDED